MKLADLFSRRNFLLASTAAAMFPLDALRAAAATSIPRILPVGRRVLFLDDFMVESLQHARLAMNPPVKVAENPVVRSDRPWEGKTIAEVTVFYDEDLKQFRMWYPVYDYHPPIPPASVGRQDDPQIADIANEYKKCTACYAVSDDGVHWEKPELGLVEFKGSKANNIVMASGPDARGHFSTGHIFPDPVEQDPQRRYKALKPRMIPHGDGQERMVINLFYSPDGFAWTAYDRNPVFDLQRPGSWGPTSYMGWDPIREVYAVYMENCGHQRCPVGKRLIGRSESPDLVHWSPPDTVLVPDETDGPGVEPYALHPCVYEDLYVGYVWIHTLAKYDHYPQLVFSRDGSRWDRRYREASMQRGALPAFDGNSVLPLKPIVHGDRIFIYYLASNYRELQQFDALGPEKAETSIGLATLPRDGFACLRNDGPERGELVTRSLQFSGRRLHVNCEMTGAGPGEIKVELMEPNYFPIEGCALDAAAPVTSTGLDHIVTWNGNADIGRLAGRTIKLRMSVANAKLFSFWFTD